MRHAMYYKLAAIFILLTSCTSLPSKQHEQFVQLGFAQHHIKTTLFLLTSYEKSSRLSDTINIYIEGDGHAWLNKYTPSHDPTPKTSLTRELAILDNSNSVVYLARPCQYTKMVNNQHCHQKYWTSHRFAPQVIKSMNDALNDIKRRHDTKQFNLIGFSGGANIALLLAAKRDDIQSIRTVAGNLDHERQSELLNVSKIPESNNAKHIANTIKHIPQLHFIGENDKIVPPAIYKSYENAIKKNNSQLNCIQSHIIKNTGHIRGWKTIWSKLIKIQPTCPQVE